MRLNGWVRLGIVASVLWVLGASVYTYYTLSEAALQSRTFNRQMCQNDKELGKVSADVDCHDVGWQNYNDHMKNGRPLYGYFVALPLVFFWLFAWIAVVVWRWVARGFKSDQQ